MSTDPTDLVDVEGNLVEAGAAHALVSRTEAPPHPLAVIQLAVERGASPETLAKLMDLQERYEANEARKAFEQAFHAFKAEAPPIFKEAAVNYQTAKGNTSYRFATLDHICEQIKPVLAKNGLSHRWDTEQTEHGARVTCYLTHVGGHSITAVLEGPLDTSGGKNPIQALGSAISYLQRYTLLTVTGLAPRGVDNDANADGKSPAQRDHEDHTRRLLEESILQKWREKLIQDDASIDDLNDMLPDLGKLDGQLKRRCWELCKDYAAGRGWVFENAKKEFVLAPIG